MTERIEAAAKMGYEELYANHEADYKNLFDRVSLDLGSSFPTDVPTNQLLKNYQNGKKNKYLEELYFQYGRYLLIASSRDFAAGEPAGYLERFGGTTVAGGLPHKHQFADELLAGL